MSAAPPAELALGAPCRTLAAVLGDRGHGGSAATDARFLVGTSGPAAPPDSPDPPGSPHHHVCLLRLHGAVHALGVAARLRHGPGPVAALAASPAEPAVLLTAAERRREATLWRMPPDLALPAAVGSGDGEDGDGNEEDNDGAGGPAAAAAVTEPLERLATLDAGGADLAAVAWRDAGEEASAGDVLTLDRAGRVCQWDIGFGQADRVRAVDLAAGGRALRFPPRAAWDPHGNGHAVAVARGPAVGILDWRADTSVPAGTVDEFLAHRYAVTDLDYNPNKPYVLATAGQDGLVKFWDLRAAGRPLLVARGGHSHWACRVRYNPSHDQLVLSAGTDALVNLWRCSTVSSAPLVALDDEDDDEGDDGTAGACPSSGAAAPNVRVDRYEHNDAVYDACWAATDPWVYVSLGYDGKVVASHVPSKEKYKILL